jgi:hypothetical protein
MAIPTGIQQYNAFLPVRVDRAPSCATIWIEIYSNQNIPINEHGPTLNKASYELSWWLTFRLKDIERHIFFRGSSLSWKPFRVQQGNFITCQLYTLTKIRCTINCKSQVLQTLGNLHIMRLIRNYSVLSQYRFFDRDVRNWAAVRESASCGGNG